MGNDEAKLARILINPEKYLKVYNSKDFAKRNSRTIFLAMKHCGNGLDLITLPQELYKRGKLDRVGGMGYLMTILESYNEQ